MARKARSCSCRRSKSRRVAAQRCRPALDRCRRAVMPLQHCRRWPPSRFRKSSVCPRKSRRFCSGVSRSHTNTKQEKAIMRKLAHDRYGTGRGGGLTAMTARAQTTEINFGIIATEASTNLKNDLGALPGCDGQGHRPEGQRLLRLGLCRRDRGHALQARCRSPGSATSRPWKRSTAPNGEVFAQSVDSDGNPGYWSHLIVHKDLPASRSSTTC